VSEVNLVNPTLSGGGSADERGRRFWSKVEERTVKKLEEFYRWDLELFGFTKEEYFRRINLES
jgi:hypothetical protein